jgi:hypothetical protein
VPLQAWAAPAAPPGISVSIDTTVADAVLQAATADAADVPGRAAAVLALPGFSAMIAKEQRYTPAATAAAFNAALIALAQGGSGEPFALAPVREHPEKVRALLLALRAQQAPFAARLAQRLNAFAPRELRLHTSLVVVLGSHQNGWVPDQKTPVFYVDAGFQSGDVDGLLAVAAHELFHTVQGAVQPDWERALAPAPGLSPKAREAHNVHAAVLNLVIEGMADYVGDPQALPGEGPGMQQARRDYERNLARSGENFALFDTILYRLGTDEAAPLGELLKVGFGGNWDQSGYYVGYVMARAIDRYRGRERLRVLVTLPPEEFVLDYIALTQAHADNADLVPLSGASVAAVQASAQALKRAPLP